MNNTIQKKFLDVISFRIASVADASIMSELNLKQLPENYPLYYWIYQLLFSNNSFLAFDGNKLVGYIFSFYTPFEHYIQTASICSLAVDSEYRNIGIASKLLDLSFSSYNIKPTKIYLHVNTKNENAIKLYQKKGYKINKLVPKYYNEKEDAYQMFIFKNF